MPLKEFLKLDADEQVEKLIRWKTNYTLKDIRDAWELKHSFQYYTMLRKLGIYDRAVRKSNKFHPDQLVGKNSVPEVATPELEIKEQNPPTEFSYQLHVSLTGPEVADKLDRLAMFLRGEQKQVNLKLSVDVTGE
ncbi:hypothetical protein ACLBWT_18855 [Paenibacillus sp. D51F]